MNNNDIALIVVQNNSLIIVKLSDANQNSRFLHLEYQAIEPIPIDLN